MDGVTVDDGCCCCWFGGYSGRELNEVLGFKGFAEGVVWVEGLIRYDEGAGASPVPLGGSPPRGDRRGVGWSVCGG